MALNRPRVVITGLGMVSSLGINTNESWTKLIDGKSGLKSIKSIPSIADNPNFPDVYMGLIPDYFDKQKWSANYVDTRLNAYAQSAVQEALEDSQLNLQDENIQENTGVNIGVMQSNQNKLSEIFGDAALKGVKQINRMTTIQSLCNMTSSIISIKYKLKGPLGCSSTACSTGASAIADAYTMIQSGQANIMIAGGAEESLCPASIHAAIRMQAMSTKKFQEPSQSSRPFDKDRCGFILSEGCGIIVLEDELHARRRGAKIYAELDSFGCTSDAYHLTRPLNSGKGGQMAMQKAFKNSTLKDKSQVNLINCHATSTPAGDGAEATAIFEFFEQQKSLIDNCLITANKSQIGHSFGAAGAIESIFTILSVQNQIVPEIRNLEKPENMPSLNFTLQKTQKKIYAALKNSFGFGGVNVSLMFKAYS